MENGEISMDIKQELGGVTRSQSDLLRNKMSVATIKIKQNAIRTRPILLLMLLFLCMDGVGFAQISENRWGSGNVRAANESAGVPNMCWLEALPDGMPAKDSDQLLQISGSLDNPEDAIKMPRDRLIACRSSAVSDPGLPEPSKSDIVIRLFSGRGFALKGNETRVLRINVELIRDVDPLYLRDLMTSNKSIEDIKDELNAKSCAASIRGSLRVNEISYSLLNTQLISSNNNATAVDADIAMLYLKPAPGGVMKPDISNKTEIVGHIKVTIAPAEGGLIGKGELIMGGDEHGAKYNVLLQMENTLPYDSMLLSSCLAPPAMQKSNEGNR